MASPNQLAANRANAQLSSGPTSSEGKAKVSHNALKTGLTGRTVLLPSEDVAAYQAHVERIFKQFSPLEDKEKRLTQSLADTLWRLDRIPSLEAGIYAIGRRELAAQFADEEDEAVRKAMIEAQIFLSYRRDLNNLSVQESAPAPAIRQGRSGAAAPDRRARSGRQGSPDGRRPALGKSHSALPDGPRVRHPLSIPPKLALNFQTEEIAAREQQIEVKAAIQNGRYYEYKKKGYLRLPDKAA